jgi:hypothetical protein
MIFDNDRVMKTNVCAVLIFMFLFAAPVLSADKLYDGFKYPPMSARPIIKWNWDMNSPDEKEISGRLDAFKKAGFGGVEITIGEGVNAQLFKFAADAAKQRGMIVDLSLGSTLGGSFISPAEQSMIISISKKQFTGPTSSVVNVNDLVNLSDPNRKMMLLYLVRTSSPIFSPGEDMIDKIKADGSVAIDINDANTYTLYAGYLHSGVTAAGTAALDLLDKRAVEKYFKTISARFDSAAGIKLGEYVRAIVCPPIDFAASNWGKGFQQEFNKQYGYDLAVFLPLILDDNIPADQSHFYDRIRRTRFNFYTFLADTYRENFTITFQKFCKDNGVLSCVPMGSYDVLDSCSIPSDIFRGYAPPDGGAGAYRNIWDKIAASTAHLLNKPDVTGELKAGGSGNLETLKSNDDVSFVSGVNRSILAGVSFTKELSMRPYIENWASRNARLSYLFQNASYQARVAIIYPRGDAWSDCGPRDDYMANYLWYLSPLLDALNHNGYTVDFIDERFFPETTFEGGKLHFKTHTYDAVIVPDMFSVEFFTSKAFRFFAANGGKIAVIGRQPLTSAGFKNYFERSVAVDITMGYVEKSDPNQVLFIPAPEKGKDNLLSWTCDMMKKIKVPPTIGISSPSDKLLFVHYLAEDRDIFYFVNTDKAASVSFRAKFDMADKKPWNWNPETGKRDKYSSSKSGELNINIKPASSLLLVFEPDPKSKTTK